MTLNFNKKFNKYRKLQNNVRLHNLISKKGKEVFWDCEISFGNGKLKLKGLDRARFESFDKERSKIDKRLIRVSIL